MLPICLGEATKLAGEILEGDKVYRFSIGLGARTATGDTEGEVVETATVPALDASTIEAVLRSFCGETTQVPPMYSAIKQGGVPLYKRARAGETVERQPRTIRIESLELLGRTDQELDCRVVCGKGTYVRVLAEDIARALGTVGHVSRLRREQVQPFDPAGLVTLEQLAAGEPFSLLPLAAAVPHLRRVGLDPAAARRLGMGQIIDAREALDYPLGTTVCLEGEGGAFLGLGRVVAPARIAPKRLVAQRVSE
jgi:tRNA pseudouridine55 synthase